MMILLLSIIGAIIAAVVGTFWYSNATPMGKLQMQYLGFDKLTPEEQQQKMIEAKPMMGKMYGAQTALSFFTSFAVVFIVTMSVQNGVPVWMAFGFVILNWLCFVVPTVGSAILWSNVDRKIAMKKFFSDILSILVTLLLTAALAALLA